MDVFAIAWTIIMLLLALGLCVCAVLALSRLCHVTTTSRMDEWAACTIATSATEGMVVGRAERY
jgi:hypothetical protein